MELKPAYLHVTDDSLIPVQIRNHRDRLLLECHDPSAFLDYLTSGHSEPILSPDVYLRGVLIPDKGAFFELCDQFGVVAEDVAQLNQTQAQALLMDRIW